MTSRRQFLAAAGASLAASALPAAMKNDISLAAWSINRSFRNGRWKNVDLPRICREELGINGIEFVNQFFENPTQNSLQALMKAGRDHDVKFVLIMIDNEGDMAAADPVERKAAAVAHRKWVDIAHYIGCHAVRCNLGGPRENWRAVKDDVLARAAESFSNLLDYSEESGLNVVIENHGRASSDPDILTAIMKKVNHPRFGTLPDFGNLNPGGDPYEIIPQLMPWAKGVSVKSRWTMDGKHPDYSLERLVKMCREAGYTGFWGIESGFDSGSRDRDSMSADEVWDAEIMAIKRTKEVLKKALGL